MIPDVETGRPMSPRQLLATVVLCVCAGAPQAAQDGAVPAVAAQPPAAAIAAPPSAVAIAAGGLPAEGREVRPVREPQIVTARLPAGVADVAERAGKAAAGAGQGTMLLALGGMIAWIVGRRR